MKFNFSLQYFLDFFICYFRNSLFERTRSHTPYSNFGAPFGNGNIFKWRLSFFRTPKLRFFKGSSSARIFCLWIFILDLSFLCHFKAVPTRKIDENFESIKNFMTRKLSVWKFIRRGHLCKTSVFRWKFIVYLSYRLLKLRFPEFWAQSNPALSVLSIDSIVAVSKIVSNASNIWGLRIYVESIIGRNFIFRKVWIWIFLSFYKIFNIFIFWKFFNWINPEWWIGYRLRIVFRVIGFDKRKSTTFEIV